MPSIKPDGTTDFAREAKQSQASAVANSYIEVFSDDLEYMWRTVSFPAASFRVQISQDLAEHKYSEKDGAEMEPTGRAPLKFSARIPFLNSLVPAANETWKAGTLYPTQLQKMIVAMALKSKGPMQHPFLGTITCVPHEFDVEWTATTRDGTWANASWIETFDSNNDTSAILTQVSPISQAIGSAQDLDSLINTIQPPLPQTPTFTPNFADTMRSIQGLFDSATFLSMKVSGTINMVGYRCNAIMDSINRASNSPNAAVYSVMNGQARMAIDRMRVACYNLQKQIAQNGSPIGLYVTKAPSTLPMIAQDISLSTGIVPAIRDLLQLNGPPIVYTGILPAGTLIRYYLPDTNSQTFNPPPPPSKIAPF